MRLIFGFINPKKTDIPPDRVEVNIMFLGFIKHVYQLKTKDINCFTILWKNGVLIFVDFVVNWNHENLNPTK